MRLVLIGAPGVGKGTQAEKLAAYYQIPHITTGGMVREEVAQGTPLGKRFEKVIARGDFLPDADMVGLVQRRLAQPDAQAGFILDGFPRNLAQAIKFAGTPQGERLDAVIALNLADWRIAERLSGRLICPVCGRSYQVALEPPKKDGLCDLDGTPLVRRPDDAPDAVLHRIAVYNEMTAPVIDYYGRLGLVRSVDASGEPANVFDQIVRSLADAAQNVSL